jgi:protein-tyrosine-phosphatase/predicted ATP-grasp superfamily ATP-dependent carboligase
MSKVLVLGQDEGSFLSVIRSLGRRGVEVHVGWCPEESFALCSRYVAQVHWIPPFAVGSSEWKDAFLAICSKAQFDLVVPCNDRTLIPLQLYRAELEPHVRIYLLNDRVFEVVSDKTKTNKLARALDVPLPREIRLEPPYDVAAVLDQFAFPVVIKPPHSFTINRLNERHNVLKAYNAHQLRAQLRALPGRGPILVQENVLGVGVGVELLLDNGDPLLTFQHVRVHEPLMGGRSSYRKSVPVQPELLEASLKLLRALHYTGVAMVEYKMHLETRRWVLMEINGRFWGSLPLAIAAGADFPWYLYQLLVEGKRDFPQSYRTGLYCRNLVSDLSWQWENLRADRKDPTLATLPLITVVKEIGRVVTFRERSDTLVCDDLQPGLVQLWQTTKKIYGKLRRGIHARMLTLPPWNTIYRRRGRQTLRRARSILFVCKGNICRSPFAERYCRRLVAPGVEVLSCGSYPETGRCCPGIGVEVAKDHNVDLAGHRSMVLSQNLVDRADIILTFDEQNRREVLSLFFTARKKLYRLGLLASHSMAEIKDPYGGGLEDFDKAYSQIARCLDDSLVPSPTRAESGATGTPRAKQPGVLG